MKRHSFCYIHWSCTLWTNESKQCTQLPLLLTPPLPLPSPSMQYLHEIDGVAFVCQICKVMQLRTYITYDGITGNCIWQQNWLYTGYVLKSNSAHKWLWFVVGSHTPFLGTSGLQNVARIIETILYVCVYVCMCESSDFLLGAFTIHIYSTISRFCTHLSSTQQTFGYQDNGATVFTLHSIRLQKCIN